MKNTIAIILLVTSGFAVSAAEVTFRDMHQKIQVSSDNPEFFEKMRVKECKPFKGCQYVVKKLDLLHPQAQEAMLHLQKGIYARKVFNERCSKKSSLLGRLQAYKTAKSHFDEAGGQPFLMHVIAKQTDLMKRKSFTCIH